MKKFLIAFLLVCLGVKPMYAEIDNGGLTLSCEHNSNTEWFKKLTRMDTTAACSLICVGKKKCEMTAAEKTELDNLFSKYITASGYKSVAWSAFVDSYSNGFSKKAFMDVCDLAFAELIRSNQKNDAIEKCSNFYTDLLRLYFKPGKPCTDGFRGGEGEYVVNNKGRSECQFKRCGPGFYVSKDRTKCLDLREINSQETLAGLTEAEKTKRETEMDAISAYTRMKEFLSVYSEYVGNVIEYSKVLDVSKNEYKNNEVDKNPFEEIDKQQQKEEEKARESICKRYGGFVEYKPSFRETFTNAEVMLLVPTDGAYVECKNAKLHLLNLSDGNPVFDCSIAATYHNMNFYKCSEKSKEEQDKLRQAGQFKDYDNAKKICAGKTEAEVMKLIEDINDKLVYDSVTYADGEQKNTKDDRSNALEVANSYKECFKLYGYELVFKKEEGKFIIKRY